MKSRLWLNIAMAVVLAFLVLLVIYQPGKEKPAQLPKLTQLNKADVKHIVLNRAEDKIELLKRDGQWWMESPYQLPASDFRVKSLLRLLETESHSQHSLAELDAATFDLAQPRASVTFNQSVTVHFGKTEPLNRRRYVAIDNTLQTIDDTFYYQVAGTVNAYLSHALLPNHAAIQAIKLPTLELQLQQGKWQRKPAFAEISSDADVELVNAWRQSQALELRPGGNQQLPATITLSLSNEEKPLRYHLLQQEDEVLLVRLDNGIQYVIGKDIAEKLTTLQQPEPPDEALDQDDAIALPDTNKIKTQE